MKNCLGIINLSELEHDIQELTKVRPIASIPFAGRYRIIDFALSNFVNSGINNVAIFTQNKFRSLVDHVESGKVWDLDRKITGINVFNPAFNYNKIVQNYGDIEHFYQSLDWIKHANEDYVFLSRSYMICNIDISKAFDYHIKSKKDITIISKKVKNSDKYLNLDTLNTDPTGNILSIGKNTGKEKEIDLSMEMYIMRKDLLVKIIEKAVINGDSNYLKQALFKEMNHYQVSTYRYNGYLACINSSKSYYDANMDMLNHEVYDQLFSTERPIFTKVKDEPSTIYRKGSKVKNALVANGCDIKGTVKNSIIFRDVTIEEGVTIENSIVMQRTHIGKNSSLKHTILDKYVTVSNESRLNGNDKVPYIITKGMNV